LFTINQGGSEDVHGRYIPATQTIKVDCREVTNNTITSEASTNEHSQQVINCVPFTPHDNTRHEELNNIERRDITANVGPDSTCLEIGNGV
jgi:hypothetical protein